MGPEAQDEGLPHDLGEQLAAKISYDVISRQLGKNPRTGVEFFERLLVCDRILDLVCDRILKARLGEICRALATRPPTEKETG